MTASLAWFYVSILAPIFSLRRLHRRRIAEKKPLKRHLFVLRWPWRKDFNKSFSRVLDLIHNALELGDGECVTWTTLEPLKPEDHITIKQVVEEHLEITANGNTIGESSSWLLLFATIGIATGIVWAGRFAAVEVIMSGELLNGNIDNMVGKTLTEWLANYTLLFAGFVHLTSRGTWSNAVHGVCQGQLAIFSQDERDALVALYIVLAEGGVKGLKRTGSYGRIWMKGIVWQAPQVSSAVLALVGQRFIVRKEGDGWVVEWGIRGDSFEVRPIGRSN